MRLLDAPRPVRMAGLQMGLSQTSFVEAFCFCADERDVEPFEDTHYYHKQAKVRERSVLVKAQRQGGYFVAVVRR